MCGVIGVAGHGPVNQAIYDGLLLLQHRGQDAAGIATEDRGRFYMYKATGLVRDVFRTRNMRSLPGLHGLGHVRYPTAGSAMNPEEAQPFYVNAPYGVTLAHNGNLTNSADLKREMFAMDRRHINTDSDSEILLNVFAHALQDLGAAAKLEAMQRSSLRAQLTVDEIFAAVTILGTRARGAFAVAMQIANVGLLAFRDPFGIRPMCLGFRETEQGTEWMVASESVAVEGLGFELLRDLKPGEAILIDRDGQLHQQQCMPSQGLHPCIFEYVYFARPDSVIDQVSVYDARLSMGALLADDVKAAFHMGDIDVVMPIPDTSRPSAMELADRLSLPYREGFIKNRYVGRTFIMPGQAVRRRSVRQKLNAMSIEFKGKSVLLVDDSIVRGTTSQEIIQMARDAGARKVYFASASPPVRFPNVYGIDMPTRSELVAHGRSDQEICKLLGADGLVYQSIHSMKQAVARLAQGFRGFEASCFDGHYLTGDVD
ncbi:MAG: amidophosphoribosyltransferase, partial [Betaproteobacteria bacterium]|nr:amidophosphoribosyltransferase [Betaproteobacteria bacterium]